MISRRLGHWHAWCRTCSAINHCAFRLDTYTMAASGVALPGTSGAVIGCCERVVPVRVLTVAATVCRVRCRRRTTVRVQVQVKMTTMTRTEILALSIKAAAIHGQCWRHVRFDTAAFSIKRLNLVHYSIFFETEETAQHTPGACSAECARAGLGIRPPLGPVPQVAPTLSREGRVLVLDARLDARTHGQQL